MFKNKNIRNFFSWSSILNLFSFFRSLSVLFAAFILSLLPPFDSFPIYDEGKCLKGQQQQHIYFYIYINMARVYIITITHDTCLFCRPPPPPCIYVYRSHFIPTWITSGPSSRINFPPPTPLVYCAPSGSHCGKSNWLTVCVIFSFQLNRRERLYKGDDP
jgi:hypothetical protein